MVRFARGESAPAGVSISAECGSSVVDKGGWDGGPPIVVRAYLVKARLFGVKRGLGRRS